MASPPGRPVWKGGVAAWDESSPSSKPSGLLPAPASWSEFCGLGPPITTAPWGLHPHPQSFAPQEHICPPVWDALLLALCLVFSNLPPGLSFNLQDLSWMVGPPCTQHTLAQLLLYLFVFLFPKCLFAKTTSSQGLMRSCSQLDFYPLLARE